MTAQQILQDQAQILILQPVEPQEGGRGLTPQLRDEGSQPRALGPGGQRQQPGQGRAVHQFAHQAQHRRGSPVQS